MLKMLALCCNGRERSQKESFPFERPAGACQISPQDGKHLPMEISGLTNIHFEVLSAENEILISRSERLEKLVHSRGHFKMDFPFPMESSRPVINYCRSTSDIEKRLIQIGDSSFCSTKEFERGDQRVEKQLLVKYLKEEKEGEESAAKKKKSRKKRNIKMWTPQEDELLNKYYELLGNKWEQIAEKIPGRNGSQCSQRWRRKFRPHKVRKLWTEEEDQELLALARVYGRNWNQIAINMKGGRTGKQVRERYLNKLDPEITNAKWTEEEDMIIYTYSRQFGPRWSEIKKLLRGRSENMIKNRYYSTIRKNFGDIAKGNKDANLNSDLETGQFIQENDFEQESFDEDEDEFSQEEEEISSQEEEEEEAEAEEMKNAVILPDNSRILGETFDKRLQKEESAASRARPNAEHEKGIFSAEAQSSEAFKKFMPSVESQSFGAYSRNQSSYTTFHTDERGNSTYPVEGKSRDFTTLESNKEMERSEEWDGNIIGKGPEEKLDLNYLLKHGASLLSEEYNPTPKKELPYETNFTSERQERLLEGFGSELKERGALDVFNHFARSEKGDLNSKNPLELESSKTADIDKFLCLGE